MRARTVLVPGVVALAATAGVALPMAFAAAPPAGNLLANPYAESPPTKPAEMYLSPAGWTTAEVDGGSQQPYDSCYGGTETEPDQVEKEVGAAIDGGARVFVAGYNSSATLTQEIPVTTADAVGKTLLIGGFFGGYQDQEDNSTLAVRFLNASGTDLGGIITPPVTAGDRADQTKLLARQATGVVPAATAKLRAVVTMTRTAGSFNDGYVDNLFVTFDATPPARPTPTGDGACTYPRSTPTTTTTTPTTTTAPTPPTTSTATQPTPPPKPVAPKAPAITSVVTGLPSAKKCVSRRSFTIKLRNPKGTTIASAIVKVNGKQVATRSGKRVTAPVNLKGLPKGTYKVAITVKLTDGRVVNGTRTYHTCAPKPIRKG